MSGASSVERLGAPFSLAIAFGLALIGCRERSPAAETGPLSPSPKVAILRAEGDATRGAALVRELECNRCHEGASEPAATLEKNCTGCHARILEGKFAADPDDLMRWQRRIHHFVTLPSLGVARDKLRGSWVARFLLEPHDVRPGLEESMPRLRLSTEQARDIAAHLAPQDAREAEKPAGDAARGRTLLEQKGCGTCHRMSGVPALRASALPVRLEGERLTRAIRLAPDLALARERLLPEYLERWLAKPSALDPATAMPDIPLTPREARDIAAYVLTAPLTRANEPKPFQRLPPLARPVLFPEVKARVLRKTCWHCHSDPDYAIGDGGPGNTGGFGFPGKRINLAEHESVLAGYVDEQGERKSLFVADGAEKDGRLVRALLARHAEQSGTPVPGIRGMPLGLPALPAEDIQLVESWIAQGRPL
ncbi:MAG TPA: cytochrome c [Polyangiaceae bacterium]